MKVYMDGVTEPYESITGTQVLLHRSEQKTKNLKKVCQFDSVAQLVELLPLKQEVQGSSPCGGTGKLEAPFDSGVRGVRCQSKEH